jgi:predicted ATPase/DNA-binding XRE family transcriptional regulator
MGQQQSFGVWLKQQRNAQHLTQEELAERVACSAALIRKIEAGLRIPSRQTAQLLAEALQISAGQRSDFLKFARAELDPDQLEEAFDQASRPRATPSNLPVSLTPLIGRGEELQAAKSFLVHKDKGVRLLTMTGPPGIGKTRLALEVARELSDRQSNERLECGPCDHYFEGGVFFVALAHVSDPSMVVSTIAQTLGVQEAIGESLLASLKRSLYTKRVLLLLDNFEQVLDASPVVLELLGVCPGFKVLVTSREALHVQGEQQFHLDALATPDPAQLPPLTTLQSAPAIALFVERARAVDPSFSLTVHNAEAVAAICARLQGLPLAIELAAARVNLLSPQEIRSRLDDSLPLLESAARHLPPRQRSLRGAIDWSYHILSEQERTLFARLGVFVGGCTLTAAESVCNATGDLAVEALDALASLVNKSLLQHHEHAGGESRFTMLETIREYAGKRLASSGEEGEIRRTHARYFLTLAEEAQHHMSGAAQREWLERLDREHDNLRAALLWAVGQQQSEDAQNGLRLAGALSLFWRRRGYLTEGREHLNAVLARTAVVTSEPDGHQEAHEVLVSLASLRAGALLAAGNLAGSQGDRDAAESYFRESLAIYRELEDRSGIASVLNNLGLSSVVRGDYPLSLSLFEESLAIERELHSNRGIATALNNMGWVARLRGDNSAARSLLGECLALYRELGDRSGIAVTLGNLGNIARNQGDYASARSLFEESLAIERELDNRESIASELGSLAYLAQAQGDYEAATSLGKESLTLLWELGGKDLISYLLILLASVAGSEGRGQRAACLWGAAEALRESMGVPLRPADIPDYESRVGAARSQIDTPAWDSAWAAGRAMGMEQAITYALEMEADEPNPA